MARTSHETLDMTHAVHPMVARSHSLASSLANAVATPVATLVALAIACTVLFAPANVRADDVKRSTDDADAAPATGSATGPATGPATGSTPTHVLMTTSMGEVVIRLDAERAPISVRNFLEYVGDKAYDGTIFHRVMADFMIQGGGFDENLRLRRPRAPIRNEGDNGLSNRRGTIAMARTSDPHSATSQFYINVVDNSRSLDHNPTTRNPGYAVFGEVVAGMDVVDKIRQVPTQQRGQHGNVPVETVFIRTIVTIDDAEAKRRIESGASAAPAAPPGKDGEQREKSSE